MIKALFPLDFCLMMTTQICWVAPGLKALHPAKLHVLHGCFYIVLLQINDQIILICQLQSKSSLKYLYLFKLLFWNKQTNKNTLYTNNLIWSTYSPILKTRTKHFLTLTCWKRFLFPTAGDFALKSQLKDWSCYHERRSKRWICDILF